MAKTPMPILPLTDDRIPQREMEVESERPCNAKFGFVPLDFPAHPGPKGNRGMSGIPPRDVSIENPDDQYRPFSNLRRGK